MIDLNDFDEAHPSGWEWDLRRLAASIWVAGRHNGTSEQPCGNAVRSCVASYRHELRRLADLPLFTRSFVRLDVDRLAAETAGPLSEQVARSAKRARHRTGDRALPPLTHEVAGERKIVEERPLITRLPAPDAELLAEALDEYLETLPSYWRRVLGGYTLVDVAHKVVGVGSVGVRAYVALLEGSSEEDVVFLHLKQARRAVLGRYVQRESAWHAYQRQRVVEYQQSSPTVSDPLLGGPRWTACRVGRENEDVAGRIECVDISMGRVAGSASGRSVVWVEDAAGVNLTESLIDAVKPGVAAVCVSAVMYGTGTRVDCAALAAHAHDVGARLIVDATQLAGAGPVRMADWGADVVVTSGYKWLCGHGGVALLAVSNGLLEAVPPHPGWMGTPSPFDFDATNREQAPGARRFQQSTIAYASALGLTESVTRLNRLGFDKMESHARRLASELIEGVEPLGWRPFRSIDDPSASPHLISLRNPNLDARRVRSMLHQEHGIVTSARLNGIRVSLHCYNDSGDVSALAKALNVIGKAAR